MANFDMILERIGPFGRYQILFFFLCSVVMVPPGFQNVMNAFLQATPEHMCHVPAIANNSVAAQSNITAPFDDGGKPRSRDPSCWIRDPDYSQAYVSYLNNETIVGNESSIRCTQWNYDYRLYGTTAVTKWNLVCDKASFPALAQSIYMVGVLLGAFVFGHLSDRYGRKLSICLGNLCIVVFGCTSAILPEFWSHVFCRMIVGMGTSGSFAVAFVFEMEIIGKNKRLAPCLSSQIFFAIGYMILPLVAFFARSVFWTNIILSLLPGIMLSYFWILPESPRWQMANGQISKAKKELARIAKMNGVTVDVDQLVAEYDTLQKTEEVQVDKRYTILDLLRTPNMRKKSLNVFFNWFVISMVYYGLTMGSVDLAGDPYLNMFLSGLVECGAILVIMVTLDRFGRRLCLAVVLIVGGVSCTVGGLLPPDYPIAKATLAMIGKFGVSGAFGIIYVFTAELFPTVVRTTAVGTGSMSARIGAIMAPFIAQMSVVWRPLPTLIFGVLSVTAGLLALLFPETLGHKLPETLEEGEEFGTNTQFCECYPCSKTRKFSETGIHHDMRI